MPNLTTAVRLIGLMSIALSLAALPARADVHDDAHIFGQQVLDDANTITDQMALKYGKQLVIETFAMVPPRRVPEVAKDKPGFFKSWMASRAKALEVNGVYVLICMDPKYVEVGAGAQTRANHIFTADDVNRLRQQIQADLKSAQYDAALAGAVQQVANTYAANIRGAKPLDESMPPVPLEPATVVAPATRPVPATRPAD